MINPKAIDEFLARKLDSFDWLKSYSMNELDHELHNMHPLPNFDGIKLWPHQKVCFILLNELKRFMLHVDMGGGKTFCILSLIKYRKQCGETPKAVVFVPYLTAVETWVEQVQAHTPQLHCVPLLGSTAENFDRLQGDGDLFVICYQSAVAMVKDVYFNEKKAKNEWNFEAKEIREYFASFNMVVMDEIHHCRSVSSLAYRMCRAISAQCEWAVGLTGTPFGRDLTALWPQYYLIDFGETLGPTLGFFREAYFRKTKRPWGQRDYIFKKRLLPNLKQAVKNCSIHYGVDEFASMPEKTLIKKYIERPSDISGYAELALQKIKAQASYEVIESNYLQLRQLASGFMTLKGEDNDRLKIKFGDNPKLDALEELIDAMPPDTKMVVFHHFVYTNELISEKLTQWGIKHARIWGGQKDPIGELRRFKSQADCRLLVLNIKSGSTSLNLQNANYVVFFEEPDSPIDRNQAECRVWRSGQLKPVFIYSLLMKDTMDVRLHENNKAGIHLLKELLSGSKRESTTKPLVKT